MRLGADSGSGRCIVSLFVGMKIEWCGAEGRTRKYNREMIDKKGLLFQKNSISCALEYIEVSHCADPERDRGRRTG